MLKHRRISWVSKKIMQPACAVTRDLHCYHLDSNFQTQIMYLVAKLAPDAAKFLVFWETEF